MPKGQSPVLVLQGVAASLIMFQSGRLTDAVHERRSKPETQREPCRAGAFIGAAFESEEASAEFMASLRDSKYDKELNYIAQLGHFFSKRMQHSAIPYRFGPADYDDTTDRLLLGRLRLIHRSPYCCSVRRTAAPRSTGVYWVEHVIDAAPNEVGARQIMLPESAIAVSRCSYSTQLRMKVSCRQATTSGCDNAVELEAIFHSS